LTLLPAILATLGRRAFWPAVPRAQDSEPPVGRVWRRVGALVGARPAATAAIVTAILVLGALGSLGGREPLDFSEAFREAPESVLGQEQIAERFIPGRAAPLSVVTDARAAETVIGALTVGLTTPVQEMYAMASSVPATGASALILSEAYLKLDPFSDAATDTVPELRRRASAAAGGAPVSIGGEVAEAYDTRAALERDTRLILPIGLGLILLILVVLLRAIVMPLYVMATVILSFAFALGVSSLIFTHLMDQPGSDRTLEQFAFIFLVALGVDYNVFLLARIREEREQRPDTKAAVIAALERTGGVITSAGLVLAATFSVLMALPLESLFQVGFVVALGLLADTFLVRALLVPSLAVLLGERNWWPNVRSRLLFGSHAKDA
jgi:RND superfamily putative drug exporter